jgi:hypothetical protein
VHSLVLVFLFAFFPKHFLSRDLIGIRRKKSLLHDVEVKAKHVTFQLNLFADSFSTLSSFQTMLQDALDFRKNKSLTYVSMENPFRQNPDFLPWTSSLGPRGMRNMIKKQVRWNYNPAGVVFTTELSICQIWMGNMLTEMHIDSSEKLANLAQ